MDSHRRLDLLAQLQAATLTVIGLQETRCRKPRAKDTGPYKVVSSAAGPRGQSRLELWVATAWLQSAATPLVLYADHRLLLVVLQLLNDTVQVVVGHALDRSYPFADREAWWLKFRSTQRQLLQTKYDTIWLIDANATIRSVRSAAVGPVHPEMQTDSGKLFHDALLNFDMALGATFQNNNETPGTWCSSAGLWRRYDYVAISRRLLPTVAIARVDSQIHLDMNIRMDHRLTAATLHLPAVRLPCTTNKLTNNNRALRAELKSPQVRATLQQDIAAFSLPHPRMSVEVHDSLLSKLFRVMWVRHSGLPQTVPRSP